MLTADLVRVRFRKGRIYPRYMDTESDVWLDRAARLCELYEAGTDRAREDLEEDIADIVGDSPDFNITRGLAKLLDDRTEWETVAPVDPVELRRMIFEAAGTHHPITSQGTNEAGTSRDDIIQSVAAALGVTPAAVEHGMYADLKGQQRIVSHKKVEPDQLLDRYNLSLAQGILLRATELRLIVSDDRPAKIREWFRMLKFFQLMHRTTRTEKGLTITVDGPVSLLQKSQRYGMQMANALPSLILLNRWQLEADVRWKGRGEVVFELGPKAGLKTHRRSRGTYQSDAQAALSSTLENDKNWSLLDETRVCDLADQDVWVPDFVLRHRDGREVLVEVVGFWRADYLERRLRLIQDHGPPNWLLCVSRKLATDKEGLIEAKRLVDFAQLIPKGRLLAAADEVATKPKRKAKRGAT